MIRRLAFAFALVSLASACGPSPAAESPPQRQDVKPGGPGCTHVVEGKCFADKASACKAAGCEADSCIELETMPMKVACKK